MENKVGGSNGFRWMGADAYLFDIDGTLMRSKDRVHFNALNHAMLEAYGIETTIAGVAYHGKTDPGILRAALERAGLMSRQSVHSHCLARSLGGGEWPPASGGRVTG